LDGTAGRHTQTEKFADDTHACAYSGLLPPASRHVSRVWMFVSRLDMASPKGLRRQGTVPRELSQRRASFVESRRSNGPSIDVKIHSPFVWEPNCWPG
jgi:hypothetical protein